jgi:DNA-binding MarR family transcriptional regulator
MQFTERDVHLLRWINGHGSATLRQIARWNDSFYQSAQRRVRQLVDHGYLERRALVYGDRAHWLTKLGRQLCADDLPPPKDIKLGSYRHNHMLVDLSLSLIADLDGRFTPERRVRQIMGFTKFGERYHGRLDALRRYGEACCYRARAIDQRNTPAGENRARPLLGLGHRGSLVLRRVGCGATPFEESR